MATKTKKVTAKQLKNKNADTILTIDGKDVELTFNFGVLGELEDIYGSIDKALMEIQSGKVKAITNFIWANMVQDDDTITVKQVGKMLDMNFIQEMMAKMGKAMNNSFGTIEGNSEDLGE